MFSPRMWRWSCHHHPYQHLLKVFSTYVEVILNSFRLCTMSMCFLHVCGGDPNLVSLTLTSPAFSPRMWRWSSFLGCTLKPSCVFSTYVEVILYTRLERLERLGFLHVCGGDPTLTVVLKLGSWFSPRMWRWSSKDGLWQADWKVFSTYVEVILFLEPLKEVVSWFSPRMWRWS